MNEPTPEAKDVAAATAVGAASRLGAARYKAKTREEAKHAGAGAAGTRVKADRRRGSLWLTALLLLLGLVAMLVLMLALGGR